MLILVVLQFNLSLLLKVSELIEVLEDEVLHTLLIYLDFNLILLNEILHLSLLVSKLGSFVVSLFLSDNPEVVDPLAFILVEASKVLFLPYERLKFSAFFANGFLVLGIINIIYCFSSHHSLLF